MYCPLLHVLAPSGAVQRDEAIEIYTDYRKFFKLASGLVRLYNAVRSFDRSRTRRVAIYRARKCFTAFKQVMSCSCMKLAACASMKLGTAAFERVVVLPQSPRKRFPSQKSFDFFFHR